MTDARPDAPVMPAASPLGAPPAGSGSTLQPTSSASAAIPSAEPLLKLLDYADDSDGCQYGSLSTSLVRTLVNEALAAAASTHAAWRPMETAPRTGKWILLGYHLEAGGGGPPIVAMWHGIRGMWCDGVRLLNADGYFSPTHWMPLPEAPREGSEPKAETAGLGAEPVEPAPKDAPKETQDATPQAEAAGVPHFTDAQILDCFERTTSGGRTSYMIAAGRAILALAARDSQAPAAPAAPVDALRKALERAVWLYENYGLIAGSIEGDPLATGRWINEARAALSRPQAEQADWTLQTR